MTLQRGEGRAKFKGLLWLVATIAIAVALAAGLEALVTLFPWSAEKALAKLTMVLPSGGVCTAKAHPEALKSLLKLESRLRIPSDREARFDVDFQVIAGSQVNAFATLGGHIYVYEGLIKQADSAEELAGVLAHEMEHVKRRHILQGAFTTLLASAFTDVQVITTLMNLHFSRKQEAQADDGAVQRMRVASIDTGGFEKFFEKLAESNTSPAFLSDHPSAASRAEAVKKYPVKNPVPLMSRSEWTALQKICE